MDQINCCEFVKVKPMRRFVKVPLITWLVSQDDYLKCVKNDHDKELKVRRIRINFIGVLHAKNTRNTFTEGCKCVHLILGT